MKKIDRERLLKAKKLNQLSNLFDEVYQSPEGKVYLPLHSTPMLIDHMDREWNGIEEKLLEYGRDLKAIENRRKDWVAQKIKDFKKAKKKYQKNQRQHLVQHTVISEYLEYLRSENKEITHYAVALFCYLVEQSGLIEKEDGESNERYTKRVCSQFKLTWKDNVRQYQSGMEKIDTPKLREAVKELILPKIDKESRQILSEHIDSKDTGKE